MTWGQTVALSISILGGCGLIAFAIIAASDEIFRAIMSKLD